MRTAWTLLVALVSCARDGGAPAAARPAPPPPPAAPAGSAAQPLEPLAGVPAEAAIVLLMSSPRPLMHLGASSYLLGDARGAALVDDVDRYLSQRTGLSLRDVRSGAVFVLADGKVAAIVHRVGGDLRGGAPVALDANTVMIKLGDDLVIGPREVVQLALDVVAGRAKPLREGRPALAGLLAEELAARAFLVLGVEVGALAGGPMALPPTVGVDRGVAAMRPDALRVTLQAPPRALPGIADQIKTILRTGAEAASREREQKVANADVLEAVGAIVTDHYVRWFVAALEPRVVGDRLVSEVSLAGGQMMVVAATGVLAAVAIPAFMKNARKAKTAEATQELARIAALARAGAGRGKKPALPRGSVGPSPPLGACCAAGGKCPADPTAFGAPLWKALGFRIDDPHYYSFSYTSDGKRFTATAQGDLDCNGVKSTYELSGALRPDGTLEVDAEPRVQNALE